ncbi:aromatic-L-amino-acid decarboxylase-like [Pholidichthys leucotaenia]
MDAAEFRRRGKEMVDYMADYLEEVENRPVYPNVEPGYLRALVPAEAPQKPQCYEDIMKDVETVIMPGVTHWQSPYFYAYFPANVSYPAILGDMLSSSLGCVGFSWAACPALTELESLTLDWLGKMLQLPECFIAGTKGSGGDVIEVTASETTLMSLLGGRAKAVNRIQIIDPQKSATEILSKLVAYTSEQAHSSVLCAGLVGMVKMKKVPTDHHYAVRGETLKKMVEEDKAAGLIPFYFCATLGTTPSCAFDNIAEIGPILIGYCLGFKGQRILETLGPAEIFSECATLMAEHFTAPQNMMVQRFMFYQRQQPEDESLIQYVDALHCLTSTCEFGHAEDRLIQSQLEEYAMDPWMQCMVREEPDRQTVADTVKWLRETLLGMLHLLSEMTTMKLATQLEKTALFADSFNFNPHKWFLVNFDCSAFWVKDRDDIIRAFKMEPVYLQYEGEESELVTDYRISMISMISNFRSLKLWFVIRMYGLEGLQAHIRKQVALAKEFESLVQKDKRFEICAKVVLGLVCFRIKGPNEPNQDLLKRITDCRKIHLVPCDLSGRFVLRFVICGITTESRHIQEAWEHIAQLTSELVQEAID